MSKEGKYDYEVPKGALVSIFKSEGQRRTTVLVYIDKVTYEGVSRCHPTDTWDRKLGQRIAGNRALNAYWQAQNTDVLWNILTRRPARTPIEPVHESPATYNSSTVVVRR